MTVLVLGEELDLTIDQVVAHLAARDVPVFRADTAWFPTELSLDTWLDTGRWYGQLRTKRRTLPLTEVRSVWYRRPTAFQFPAGMSDPERRHAGWEAKFGLGGVLATLPVLWVNHPNREADACYKPVQLATARRCGLSVPDTIVTNEPEAVRRFATRAPEGIVVKTLSTPAVLEAGGITVAHTHRLTHTDLEDLTGIEHTAHLFQAWVEKAYEVRVTVVDERMFPVAIDAGNEDAREDWRNDFDALTYRVVEIPDPIGSCLHQYMTALGLHYAAVDFAVDHDGRWWFLEANPGGQYSWLQSATGQPISTAIADLLERGKP